MKWNLLTVIVLLVILLYAVKGYRKGFVKTLAAMLCLAVTLVLVYFATPYVSTFLKENTPVYEVVEEQCGKLVGNLGENVAGNKTAQDAYINSLELPEAVKKQLVSNNDPEKLCAAGSGELSGISDQCTDRYGSDYPGVCHHIPGDSADPHDCGGDFKCSGTAARASWAEPGFGICPWSGQGTDLCVAGVFGAGPVFRNRCRPQAP